MKHQAIDVGRTYLVKHTRRHLFEAQEDWSPFMSTLVVSSKGQIVLPVGLRNRLGMGAGARLEEPDGLKLRVVRPVVTTEVQSLAGMVKAPAKGAPRRLEDFDPASLLKRSRDGTA